MSQAGDSLLAVDEPLPDGDICDWSSCTDPAEAWVADAGDGTTTAYCPDHADEVVADAA